MNFQISDVFSATLQIHAWKTTQNPRNHSKNLET